jgi:hypothetical protein
MHTCELLLHKEEEKRCLGSYHSVSEVISATKQLRHAGERELSRLLKDESLIPCTFKGKEVHRSSPLLFCGTIYSDDRDNEYVIALYHKSARGWVTERYWLKDPFLSDLFLVVLE